MSKGLFTFGIASYNNYEYLKEAVDSVLMQDYDDIELIISNDGSKDFKQDEIALYIDEHKGSNIKSVVINNSEKNQGTVRNVNYIAKNAHGEYIMFMAADDALYDEHVISTFIEEFSKQDVHVLSGQVAMCGIELDDVKNLLPEKDVIELISSGDNQKMFSRMTYESFMPTTSTCYRMSALKESGYFDETYFIIEDATKFLYLARNGYKFGWINGFVAARHRDGGISHGNQKNKSEAYRRYRFDEIALYSKEILPYINMIEDNDKKKMQEKWHYLKSAYYLNFLLQDNGEIYYQTYDEEICREFAEEMLRDARIEQKKIKIKDFLFNKGGKVSLKYKCLEIYLIIISFFFTEFIQKMANSYSIFIYNNISVFAIYILYIILLLFLFRCILDIIYNLLWRIYNIRRRIKDEKRKKL